MQYRVVSLAGLGGQPASSLLASAAVLTGLVIAVISIPVAWATSFLKPQAITDPTEAAAAA